MIRNSVKLLTKCATVEWMLILDLCHVELKNKDTFLESIIEAIVACDMVAEFWNGLFTYRQSYVCWDFKVHFAMFEISKFTCYVSKQISYASISLITMKIVENT